MRQFLKVLAWFVAFGGDCRNKWKKKSGNFLEIENKLRNFAMSIKNSKVMVKKNEEESPRALKEKELESVNGGGGGGNRKRRKYES